MTANHKLFRLGKLVSFLLILALLAGAWPQPASAQTCVRNHTVVAGDTVSNIAETYKVTIAELATANSLVEPYTIYIGQVLCIPGSTTTTTTSTSGTTSTTSTGPALSLTVFGNKIVVEAEKFPKNATYYVRAGEKDFKHGQWVRLGRVRSRKDGSIDGIFLFPKGLRNSKVVQICLKDVTNDDVFCGRIYLGK